MFERGVECDADAEIAQQVRDANPPDSSRSRRAARALSAYATVRAGRPRRRLHDVTKLLLNQARLRTRVG